jgi:hypothetical protein
MRNIALAEYVAELNRRSERGFDPAVGATALPHEVRPPSRTCPVPSALWQTSYHLR